MGLHNTLAHSALADAQVTAQLLQYFLRETEAAGDDYVQEQVAAATALSGLAPLTGWDEPTLYPRAFAMAARQAAVGDGWFRGLVATRQSPSDETAAGYFKLLDAALLDHRLSATEQAQLLGFARDHGLDADGLRELHEIYVTLLVEKAWADGIITPEERTLLTHVCDALGIPSGDLDDALAQPPQASAMHQDPAEPAPAPDELGGLLLAAGDRVTVTGASLYSNDEWGEFFAQHGVELAGLAKKTKVLIAADPDSQSGKAKKAKAYGIPIIAEDVARDILRFTS